MRKIAALLAAPLLLAPALCLAASSMSSAPAFDVQRFSQDVKALSDDSFEGRAPATEGEKKTIAYIVGQMKAAGLKPGMPDGTWTQSVPLLKSDIVGAPKLALKMGDGASRALTQGEEIAVRAALTGQDKVDLASAPLVFVGYGVKAPERGWDDFKGADLKGKILVVLVNDPDFEGGEGDFGGKTMTYYGRWTYKYEEGARQGAAGVLVVHEYAPASYGWPTVKNSNTNTMFDIVRADPKAEHVAVEGWIQRDLAVDLFKAAGLDFEAMKKAAQKKDFKPVALNATLDASYAVKAETITSYNVLGRLAGAKHPNETVIYSGHWDHLGVGQPDAKGDRIYNGARDNASGIAALLELGRAFAKAPRTDRSVLFLAVTAEEKGLLGSEYYAANPVYPLARTAGVINMDSIIGEGAARDFTISGVAKLGLLDLLVAEGRKLGRVYVPDPKTETGGFYRSDHFPMAKAGVPAVSFKGGIDLVDGGVARGQELGAIYTRDRYHQPADEWSADMNLSNVAPDLTLLYDTGRALADSRAWPDWAADAEFKAKRDETAAQRK
ncbi:MULTISPECIES: M28 family metallopeptidase [unclassified Sphingomonas]|uniref:M28 family metallopeptidase n=1 Tax=unclassified Sphingomonas TaxID=196159 RepID=UPI0006F574A0|nr:MULTISPECIES: M28 family metallopeptidase [unclassified Sphingomonas]KQX20221.1 peptidase M20 [Sphingomonas sp. Root1294]KQY67471.1 peptidase M20 [Sphingomonas sp. Root50]KRB90847.1 peptidase M20 [Sphingomonas sp. Root720]